MKPDISIIVATKNRPDYLYRCLLAIWRSKFVNFECIVVGDNCDYAEAVLLDRPFVNDKRFIYYKITTPGSLNVGVVAKNIGIEIASSNKICYCDDDNIIMPFHLSTFMGVEFDFGHSRFIEMLWGHVSTAVILNNDLYCKKKIGVSSSVDWKDGLVICHTKDKWKEVGGWKTWNELGSRNEDGDFMRRLIASVDQKKSFNVITAIYNQHEWSDDDKESPSYREGLKRIQDRYVFPELVYKLKARYGVN